METERTKKQLRISLLGPQGSGKGTQAELLSFHLGIPIITMSALLKAESQRGGEQAKMIEKSIRTGSFVPSSVTINLLTTRLAQSDTKKGFIIDGFPRFREQQDAFVKINSFTDVVFLDIPEELALERINGRLVCGGCGKIYHEKWNPPKQSGKCDECAGTLEKREDDVPEAIRVRLARYHRETEPVIVQYRQEGLLRRVDASGSIPVVHAAILETLGVPPTPFL